MARFNFSSVSKIASTRDSVAWGKINFEQNSTLVFAALLIVCSLAVGCSSEKPKSENSISQTPVTQVAQAAASTPTGAPATLALEAPPKPVHKKVVRKVPPTVMFADKSYGVSFQYPRKFVLKSGEGAKQLLSEGSAPMGFVQPGGFAVAAVAIPEGAYPKSNLASASFEVSVNKSLTQEQCGGFATEPTDSPTPSNGAAPATTPSAGAPSAKMMIGDMELQSWETLATVGPRTKASKFYHVFENGGCYEFALKVATAESETDEGGKRLDRDEVFKRLEKILATVKISPVKSPEVAASAPAVAVPTTATATPAQ